MHTVMFFTGLRCRSRIRSCKESDVFEWSRSGIWSKCGPIVVASHTLSECLNPETSTSMNPETSLILADIGDVIAPDDSAKRALTSICISVEQDPDFGVQSGETYEIFWIWIGLDIVFLSTGFRNRMSKWNQIWPCKKSWYGTIVVWGKITIFRNHILKIYLSDSLDRLQCSPPLGILTFRMRTSQARCSLDLCEDEHNWFYSFVTTQPVVIEMRQVHFWNVFINRSYCSKIQQTNFSLAASFWGIGCTKFGRMSQIST